MASRKDKGPIYERSPDLDGSWRLRMTTGEDESAIYGPAEVAHAARIPRTTFHSWIARRYLPTPSRGRGKSRQFSLLDTLKLGVMVRLTWLGIGVARAQEYVLAIERLPDPGDYLLCAEGSVRVLKNAGALSIEAAIKLTGGEPVVLSFDLFELLKTIKGILENPKSVLDVSDLDQVPHAAILAVVREKEPFTHVRVIEPRRTSGRKSE